MGSSQEIARGCAACAATLLLAACHRFGGLPGRAEPAPAPTPAAEPAEQLQRIRCEIPAEPPDPSELWVGTDRWYPTLRRRDPAIDEPVPPVVVPYPPIGR